MRVNAQAYDRINITKTIEWRANNKREGILVPISRESTFYQAFC